MAISILASTLWISSSIPFVSSGLLIRTLYVSRVSSSVPFVSLPKCCLEEHDLPSDKPIRFAIRLFRQKACLLWLTLARLISLFLSPLVSSFPWCDWSMRFWGAILLTPAAGFPLQKSRFRHAHDSAPCCRRNIHILGGPAPTGRSDTPCS